MEDISKRMLRLINNSHEFLELNSILKKFNPFKILNINEVEIRHSNFLAWLINPNENHEIHESFLKHLLFDFVTKLNMLEKYSFDVLHNSNLKKTQVFREYKISNGKSIDILIVCSEIKTVIIIENKIRSKEHSNQLTDYYNFTKNKYKEYHILPIYLTLSGDSPSDKNYLAYEYANILEYIDIILKSYEDRMPQKQYEFISYYKDALKGVLQMDDEKAVVLAKSVYAEYKDVIDFISTNVEFNQFYVAGQNFIKKHNLTYEGSTGRSIFFVNDELKLISDWSMQKWLSTHPVCFWFRKNGDSKLGIIIEVGPVTDLQKRNSLLEAFQKDGFKFQKNAFESGTKYTRVFSEYKEFEDWDEVEIIEQFLEKLYFDVADAWIKKTNLIIKNFNP
jgi:hypothetical protein